MRILLKRGHSGGSLDSLLTLFLFSVLCGQGLNDVVDVALCGQGMNDIVDVALYGWARNE